MDLLPLLKPATWPSGERTLHYRLYEAQPAISPQVAFVFDDPAMVKFLSAPDDAGFADLDELRDHALGNLARRLPRPETIALESMRLFLVSGDYYAAEAVLLPRIHAAATEALEAELLAVATPCRGLFMATSGVQEQGNLAAFLSFARRKYLDAEPSDRISATCFAAQEGQVIGHIRAENMPEEETAAAPETIEKLRRSTNAATGEVRYTAHVGHPEVSRLRNACARLLLLAINDSLGVPGFAGAVDYVLATALCPPAEVLMPHLEAMVQEYEQSEILQKMARERGFSLKISFRYE